MSPPRWVYGPTRQLRDGRAKSIVPTSSGATLADKPSMSEDNDSVLGNLPRSRPGVRSDKRASAKRPGGVGGAESSPPAPKARPATKPRAKAAAKPKSANRTATRPSPPATPPPATSAPEASPTSPAQAALRAGEAVAVTGIKVAGRVAGEILRRLPRP
jgi:hypothetical protein